MKHYGKSSGSWRDRSSSPLVLLRQGGHSHLAASQAESRFLESSPALQCYFNHIGWICKCAFVTFGSTHVSSSVVWTHCPLI
jgi:hypothetical protein